MFNFIKEFFEDTKFNLKERIEDERDLLVKEFFGLTDDAYTPLYKTLDLGPVYQQNQLALDDCDDQAGSNVLADYFGQEISVRWLHAKAYQQGWCDLNGGTALETVLRVARQFGVIFASVLPNDDTLSPEDYVNVDFTTLDPLAAQNKIGSYYRAETVNDCLRALDKGYAILVGMAWKTGDDTLVAPFILTHQGLDRGGHALEYFGYRDNQTFRGDNSWGTAWGDQGKFYDKFTNALNNIVSYGAYIISQVPYTPKQVKINMIESEITSLEKTITMLQAQEQLYNVAKSLIGVDLAPGNEALGCAISFAAVCNKAFGDGVRFVGTTDAYTWMLNSPKWEKIDQPEPMCAIVSVTGQIPADSPLTGANAHGHIGIVGKLSAADGSLYVMSNSSSEGQWDTTFTLKKWEDYFVTYALIPTYYFRRIA